MEVQHPLGEGTPQAGAQALEDEEAAAGELAAALEIDDVQGLAKLPVGLMERGFGGLALRADDDVGRFVWPVGDVIRGEVGDLQQELVQAALYLPKLPFQALQPFAEEGGAGDQVAAAVLGVLGLLGLGGPGQVGQFADLLRYVITLGAEGFDLLEGAAPVGVEGEDVVQGGLGAAAGKGAADPLWLLTDQG